VAALFAVWELLSRTGIVNPRLLPSASDTLVMLWELLQRAGIRNDLMVTASEVLTAFILAVPIGALIGFCDRGEPLLREVAKPLLFFRLQHSEIDLPADVHPGVRRRLSRKRSVSGSSQRSSLSLCRRRRRWSPSRSSI